MKTLRLVLGDQLTRELASLKDIDRERDVILMAEVADETVYVPHHPQKIAFIFSAMRHFAERLKGEGFQVEYIKLDDLDNSGSFEGEVARSISRDGARKIVLTEPGEYRVLAMMEGWAEKFGIPVEIRTDDRFFCDRAGFSRWADGRKQLRMEFFYREMRRDSGFLMDGDAPAGGQWNYDSDNRKPLPGGLGLPRRTRFEPDEITREVLALVRERFKSHYGTLEPFGWGVTRADALAALDHFVSACLPSFGDVQDAMKQGEPFLFHALLSPYLNCGLLTAREVCERAELAYRADLAPLNAVEGFIRQILGWREYVRGIYWLKMPDYAETNALSADRKLPDFYWTGETKMNCLHQCVSDTMQNAYAHHIQRLMVLGNFALLAGIAPREIEAWYLAVYADAYEWVELPNVHGMVLYADGGLLASKPYAASGAYIDRMSDYCKGCVYDVKQKTGEKACPFNILYWNFMIKNKDVLAGNPRMAMPFRTLHAMDQERRLRIETEAGEFLALL